MRDSLVMPGATTLLLLAAGCAGPFGPPLGFGPGWDEAAGLILFAVIVAIVFRPLQRFFTHRHDAVNIPSAESIVRERYARGEITQQQAQTLLRNLTSLSGGQV